MINHLRTLLLNRDGTAAAPPETPGEEYVPPDYKAVAMPQALAGLLASLFGTQPDRVFLNARLRQFLSLMRVCRLDGPIPPGNDARLSYEGSGGETLFAAVASGVNSVLTAGPTSPTDPSWIQTILHSQPRALNRLYRTWDITVVDADTARLNYAGDDGIVYAQEFDFVVESGGASLTLPEMPVTVLFPPSVGATWRVSLTARPLPELAELVGRVDSLLAGGPASDLLFAGQTELRQVFSAHPAGPFRLSAALRALALLTEELRGGPR